MNFIAIGKKDVEKYKTNEHAVLIDLRSKEEYQRFHLPGALNLPYEEIDIWKSQLTKNRSYILYCERGGSSMMAAKDLTREGYRVFSVIGGIMAWEESKLD